MKSIQLYLTAIILLLCFIGKAQEATFPLEGPAAASSSQPLYADYLSRDQHCQIIYPASGIPSELKGAEITEIAFHTSTFKVTWGSPVGIIKLMNTTAKNVKNDFIDVSKEVELYNGNYTLTSPDGMSGRVIFKLKKPFVYTGGNLLLDIASFGGAVSPTNPVNFTGKYSPVNNCLRHQNEIRPGDPVINVSNFLPLLTVKYTPGIMEEVVTLSFSSMTNNSVTINGQASNITGDLGFKYNVNGGVWQYVIANKQNMTGYTAMKYNITGLNVGSVVTWRAWGKGTKDTVWGEQLNVTIKDGCIAPTLTEVTDIYATVATINWLEGSPASLFNIRYKAKSDNNWVVKNNVSHGFLTGLSPGKIYEVQVQTVCSPTTTSAWSAPKYFLTSCGKVLPPYFEDFTSHYTLDELCYKTDVTAASDPTFFANIKVDTDSKNIIVDNTTALMAMTFYLMLPTFDVQNVNLLRLRFRAFYENIAPDNPQNNKVEIGVVRNDRIDQFVLVEDIGRFGSTADSSIIVDLAPYSMSINGTERITIKMTIMGSTRARIEDIEVTVAADDCLRPYNVTASNVQLHQADVDWFAEPDQTEWEIQYRSETSDDWTEWELLTTKNRPYTLTNLTHNTTYQVRMKTICDNDEMSGFSQTIDFKTLDSISSISEFNLSSIHVYSYLNSVYVVNHNNLQINKVEIYDLFGRLVHQGLVNDNPEIINMNVPVGNYIVRIITPNALKNYKVFVTK